MDVQLNPEEWRWKMKDGAYVPITTDLQPAPEEMLSVISCRCKTGCKSQLCTCCKHGLHCVATCKSCYGEQCDNREQSTTFQADDIDVMREAEVHDGEHTTHEVHDDEETTLAARSILC